VTFCPGWHHDGLLRNRAPAVLPDVPEKGSFWFFFDTHPSRFLLANPAIMVLFAVGTWIVEVAGVEIDIF